MLIKQSYLNIHLICLCGVFSLRSRPCYLSGAEIHHLFGDQVTFVPHQQLGDVSKGVALDLLQPLLHVVKSLLLQRGWHETIIWYLSQSKGHFSMKSLITWTVAFISGKKQCCPGPLLVLNLNSFMPDSSWRQIPLNHHHLPGQWHHRRWWFREPLCSS